MSRHPVINFLKGGPPQPLEERRPVGMPPAGIVGEGFFYKEGAKVKTWKFRKFTLFDNGLLMYFSPMRKLYKGEFSVRSVEVLVPSKGSRSTRPIDVMLGDSAFEMRLKSASLSRPLCLLFRTDEEAMIFMYYLSQACTTHNIPAVVKSIGKQALYDDCQRILEGAAKAHGIRRNSEHSDDGDAATTPPRSGDKPREEKGENIFHVTTASVAARRRSASEAVAFQQKSNSELDAISGLSSPPPKRSAQPELKGPVGTPARRLSRTDSIQTDDDNVADDFLFLSLWNENNQKSYQTQTHGRILLDIHSFVFSGNLLPAMTRPFWWRLALGILSSAGPSSWPAELEQSIYRYQELRQEVLPVMSEAKNDPLSSPLGLCSPSDREWGKYYRAREKLNFIQLDINRLYLSDVDDSYFEDHDRRMALQNILVLWSTQHEDTAYRQGMHELAGALYYVVEAEAEAWLGAVVAASETTTSTDAKTGDTEQTSADSKKRSNGCLLWHKHPLKASFCRQNVEAYTYWLFERIMVDLECLYDPNPAADGHPRVLHYCFAMQENLLNLIDSDLCGHLESEEISCQLYGMRWSRLLLSREFRSMENQVLRIWDFLFLFSLGSASCKELNTLAPSNETPGRYGHSPQKEFSAVGAGLSKAKGGDSPHSALNRMDSGGSEASKSGVKGSDRGYEGLAVLPGIQACTLDYNTSTSMETKSVAAGEGHSLKWNMIPHTNILAPLQFLMVSMLVFIREDLLDSDNNIMMAHLMRYPDTDEIQHILDRAYLMSRGEFRVEPHVVVPRQRKRDIVFKNLQKIGKFGSKVTKSIRLGGTLVGAPNVQSAPSTPLQPADVTVTAAPKTSPRPGGADNPPADNQDGKFEMEMNAGLFSPTILSKKHSEGTESEELKFYRKLAALLSAEGDSLVSAASLASFYVDRKKYYDDVYNDESSSSDENVDDGPVVRKRAAALPPPTIDKTAAANRLRALADVIEGKKTLEDFEKACNPVPRVESKDSVVGGASLVEEVSLPDYASHI